MGLFQSEKNKGKAVPAKLYNSFCPEYYCKCMVEVRRFALPVKVHSLCEWSFEMAHNGMY